MTKIVLDPADTSKLSKVTINVRLRSRDTNKDGSQSMLSIVYSRRRKGKSRGHEPINREFLSSYSSCSITKLCFQSYLKFGSAEIVLC